MAPRPSRPHTPHTEAGPAARGGSDPASAADATPLADDEAASLRRYYALRAAEYDRIYDKPERQADLTTLRTLLPELLSGHAICEVACGTGYWTHVVAPAATAIWATDTSAEVLDIARSRRVPQGRVTFGVADAFALPDPPFPCTAALAAFWWSHLHRGPGTARFLRSLLGRLQPGARVVLLDNAYVHGSSTPVSRTDDAGNTYQLRRLDDGSTHEILKNFPSEACLRGAFAPFGAAVRWHPLAHYWVAVADLPRA